MGFRSKIEAGEFVVSCEVDPPKVPRLRRTLEKLEAVEDWVDGFSVSDNPLAGLRMDAVACATLLRQRFPKDVVLHITCRDFTLLALHSRLLGAYALGLDTVLCLTGDPPKLGTFPQKKGAYPCNSVGLVKVARSLNQGFTSDHQPLRAKTDFLIGVAANPGASNLKAEIERLRRKADAGARFIKTQPVFDLKTLERFLDAASPLGLPVVLGVMPLVSVKFAQHIVESIPEVFIPARILTVLEEKDSEETGLDLSAAFLEQARHGVQGIHVFPMARYRLVPALCERIGFARNEAEA